MRRINRNTKTEKKNRSQGHHHQTPLPLKRLHLRQQTKTKLQRNTRSSFLTLVKCQYKRESWPSAHNSCHFNYHNIPTGDGEGSHLEPDPDHPPTQGLRTRALHFAEGQTHGRRMCCKRYLLWLMWLLFLSKRCRGVGNQRLRTWRLLWMIDFYIIVIMCEYIFIMFKSN